MKQARKLNLQDDEMQSLKDIHHLSDEVMSALFEQATIEDLFPGEFLLTEGQLNFHLFFLVSGEIVVQSQGKTVSHHTKKGDLFGEMSLIQKAPCRASVKAVTALKILKVQIPSEASAQHLIPLFQLYASVLCEKLDDTNKRAREFEVLTNELKIAQTELLDINSSLEEKVLQRGKDLELKNKELSKQNSDLKASYRNLAAVNDMRNDLVQHLMKLKKQHFPSLFEHLAELELNLPENYRGNYMEVRKTAQQIDESLTPIVKRYEPSLNLKKKNILIIDSNKKHQAISKTALAGTGSELDVCSTVAEGTEMLLNKKYDVMLCSADLIDIYEEATRIQPELRCVLLTQEPVSSYLGTLRDNPKVENVIAKMESDRAFTVKSLTTTVHKMANDDIFGLDKYLSWGTNIISRKVTHSKQRPELKDEITAYFQQVGLRRTIVDRCLSVCEELLMNAIYDAPVNSKGESRYNHLNRIVPVDLEEHEFSEISFGCDGMIAAISVSDPFGSLERSVFINYLERNYLGQGGHLEGNKGGAGHGFHMVVEISDLLVINVKKNIKSEVIALFQVANISQSEKSPPAFQFFFEDVKKPKK